MIGDAGFDADHPVGWLDFEYAIHALEGNYETTHGRYCTAGRAGAAPAANGHGARQLRFGGDLAIDLDRRSVQSGGEPIDLTSTEFDLLAMLALAPGKVFSRDDILERLRGQSAEDIHTRAVDILVSRLRRKLEPLDCIKTLRNAGYTLAGVRA